MSPIQSRRKRKLIAFIVLLFLVLQIKSAGKLFKVIAKTVGLKAPKFKQREVSEGTYIIPYLKGQGINNQLWEYRTAAIVAKATNRLLCLEPFHRFYLLKSGHEFIPFEDIFDVSHLSAYVKTESKFVCAQKCKGMVQEMLEITQKRIIKDTTSRDPFPIPSWRPGSLDKFRRSTGFRHVPTPNLMNFSEEHRYISMVNVKDSFKNFVDKKCVAVSGTLPQLNSEFLLWSRAMGASQKINDAVRKIKKLHLNDGKYLAVHWRFEETKCSGIGAGIGYGRARRGVIKSGKHTIRRSDQEAKYCFYAGQLPASARRSGIWLRLVSRKAIHDWIKRVMEERDLNRVYLATDCHDPSLINWLKRKAGAITQSDIKYIISNFLSLDQDLVSRVEQQICIEAEVFAGTLTSSWTSTVVENRLNYRDQFFVQDKQNFNVRPDPRNRTFYMDVESCNCDI